jgi:tetratricopeptide (TPR) repeat protein
MNSGADRIHPVLAAVRPFVAKGDFASACEHIGHAVEEAVAESRLEDAATLSSILGSFHSIDGADELALAAFERAEKLAPENLHHTLSTARHLLTRIGAAAEAEVKAANALLSAGAHSHLTHAALAVVGQCLLVKGDLSDAISHLRQAQKVAVDGGIDPSLWDLSLVEAIMQVDAGNDACRSYAQALLQRARALKHTISEKRALALLSGASRD